MELADGPHKMTTGAAADSQRSVHSTRPQRPQSRTYQAAWAEAVRHEGDVLPSQRVARHAAAAQAGALRAARSDLHTRHRGVPLPRLGRLVAMSLVLIIPAEVGAVRKIGRHRASAVGLQGPGRPPQPHPGKATGAVVRARHVPTTLGAEWVPAKTRGPATPPDVPAPTTTTVAPPSTTTTTPTTSVVKLVSTTVARAAPTAPATTGGSAQSVPFTAACHRTPPQLTVGNVEAIVRAAATKYGISGDLLVAMGSLESGLNANCESGPYLGLFNFLPSTFARYGGTNILDPKDQAEVTAYMISIGQGNQFGSFRTLVAKGMHP